MNEHVRPRGVLHVPLHTPSHRAPLWGQEALDQDLVKKVRKTRWRHRQPLAPLSTSMGEYYKIVDIDGREVYKMPLNGGKLIELFWTEEISAMIDLLVVSPTAWAGWDEDKWPVPEEDGPRKTPPQTAKLLTLANELLREIFKWIGNLQDATFFSLVDGTLAIVGAYRVRELLDGSVSPWAGHRVLCFGDSSEHLTFPKTLRDVVKGQMQAAKDGDDFHSFVYKTYKRRRAVRKPRWLLIVSALKKRGTKAALSPADRRSFDALIAYLKALGQRMAREEIDKATVLCNITRGKYVLGSAVQKKYKRGWPTLGHLLLGHICWSDEGDPHFKNARCEVTEGPWAGDQFEVTTLDKLRPDIKWEDATKSALARLIDLWEATEHE